MIEELKNSLMAHLIRKDIKTQINRVNIPLNVARADYHFGNITLEELLAQFKKCAVIHEDYVVNEQCEVLFEANAHYIDYLYK